MNERRLLQCAVAVACLVPLLAGGAGMVAGLAAFGQHDPGTGADSHARYLSGLLFGIGVAFALTIPTIETAAPRFRLLTAIVFLGGLARLAGLVAVAVPPPPMLFGLAMELLITPALCLWQARIARTGVPAIPVSA